MQSVPITPEQLLSDVDVAKVYGIKVATIRKWRIIGKGPRWIKLGSLVRYKVSDVNEFLESCPVGRSA